MHDEVFRNEVHSCLQPTSKKKKRWTNGWMEEQKIDRCVKKQTWQLVNGKIELVVHG